MNRPRNFEEILAKFPDRKPNSNGGYTASCILPVHKTPAEHITLNDAGDKALITCHGGKHNYQDFCNAWGYESLAYSDNGNRRQHDNTRNDKPAKHERKPVITNDAATVDTTVDMGITLAQLAETKHLDIDFIKSLGVKDTKYDKLPAVKIPWYNAQGQEVSIHFRLKMHEPGRFRWRSGDRPSRQQPYGINRLPQIMKAGWVLIVEGESDCWTCWAKGIPALGAPGKGVFPSEWSKYLDGIDVYVWQEPDAEDFTWIVYKAAAHCKVIITPENVKDISQAHIQGKDIVSLLENLKVSAIPVANLVEQANDTKTIELYQQAKAIIESADPLEVVEQAIREAGYGGDIRPAIITYYSATSRVLAMREGAMPVHLLLAGLTSAGKSFTLRVILGLLPPEAYHVIDAGSPRVLIYDDADLQHRVLIFGEADSLPAGEDNPAASAIRNLLQDHSMHYNVTEKDAETGNYTVRKIYKPGPTVLITTSTKPLGDQLNSRLYTLECSDTAEQIAAALGAQARLELGEINNSPNDQMVAFQAYLQVKTPWKVIVPFARVLAEAMGKMKAAPRILRDYARLISLIKVVAILRHHNRQTDDSGHIVAQLEDYEIIRSLIGEMYIESTTGAAANIRQLVEAVRELQQAKAEDEVITNTALSKRLDIGIKQVTRRAKKAMRQGWLVNKEQRKSYPADYAIGEPMPPADGLPLLTADIDVKGSGITGKNDDSVVTSGGNTTSVDTLTPITDSKANTNLDTPAKARASINDIKISNGIRVDPKVDVTDDILPDADPFDNVEPVSADGIDLDNIIKHWYRAGAPDNWQGAGTNDDCLDDLLRDPNCPEHIIDLAIKWHIENGGE